MSQDEIECHFDEICEVGRRFAKMDNDNKEPKVCTVQLYNGNRNIQYV